VDDQRALLAQDARSAVPSFARDEAFELRQRKPHTSKRSLRRTPRGRSRALRGMSASRMQRDARTTPMGSTRSPTNGRATQDARSAVPSIVRNEGAARAPASGACAGRPEGGPEYSEGRGYCQCNAVTEHQRATPAQDARSAVPKGRVCRKRQTSNPHTPAALCRSFKQ
jgi:hypothetical protein